MSRKVVSYSDLAEEAPSPSEPIAAEDAAGPSTNRKRKAAGNGHSGGQKQKQKQARKQQRGSNGTVHWDDPSYTTSTEVEAAEKMESYRIEFDAYRQGEGDEDAEGDGEGRFFDADEDEEDGECEVGENGEDEGAYTAWKYDERGRPYEDGPYASPDDDEEADHYIHSDQEEDDEDPTSFPFAIPSVEEFHATYDATHTLPPPPSSATLSHTHRPPVEVGGGGRTLTHSEIWGPRALVDAYNSALSQFCSMHSLPSPSLPSKESALWNDAPHHTSLLAQQVREDTTQILAIAKSNGKEKEKGKEKGRGKQLVTHVECANVPGNAAWKKAIKTVQTTPNHIGAHAEWYAGYYAGIAAAAQAQTQTGTQGSQQQQ